jgi:hypothetical protein
MRYFGCLTALLVARAFKSLTALRLYWQLHQWAPHFDLRTGQDLIG